MERIAWLDPDAIPEALLTIAPPGIERNDGLKVLTELSKYSLVTRDSDAVTPHFSIHRLVQAATRHSLSRQNAEIRLGETVKWLAEAMKPVGSKFTGKTADLIPHVLSVLHFLQTDDFRDSESGDLLDPLARLVIFALLLTKEGSSPSRSGTRYVVPEYLISILGGFYEVEPLSAAVSYLIQDDYESWPTYRDQLLSSDNYVLRYAMSDSLAETCLQTSAQDLRTQILSDVVALVDNDSDLNKFELGGYAVSQIYAADPDLIGRSQMEVLANRLAEHEAYPGRSILGDLLLKLVLQKGDSGPHSFRGLVTSQRFWNPIWDFLKFQVATIKAAEAFTSDPTQKPSSADDLEVAESFQNLQAAQDAIQDILKSTSSGSTLRSLLENDNYFALGLHTESIRKAEDELGRRPDLLEIIRLFFRHPLWTVGEAAATVLSTLIPKDERHTEIITTLLDETSYWKVRYGAMEAAFALRHHNEKIFLDSVHRFYDDGKPSIGGLCAENLVSVILNSAKTKRADLMRDFEKEIQYWSRSEDCWILEHVHHLFHELDKRHIDVGPLLSPQTSRLFAGQAEWYRLPREDFFRHIERQKLKLTAAQ